MPTATVQESTQALPKVITVAALIIEPLGPIMCVRSKLEIADRSQVFSQQMIDKWFNNWRRYGIVCDSTLQYEFVQKV
jgi:hypothetical protein